MEASCGCFPSRGDEWNDNPAAFGNQIVCQVKKNTKSTFLKLPAVKYFIVVKR